MARTQEQRKAETRSRLLAAAAEMFARRGVHNTSADTIAEAADRTSGALYAHFGSKDGLLLALVAEWEHEVARHMGDTLAAAEPGRDRLAALWDGFANTAATGTAAEDETGPPAGTGPNGDTWRLLEHELLLQAARSDELADTLAGRYGYARRSMGDAFDNWAAEDETPLPLPGPSVATLVLGLLLGLELQRRLEPDAVPDDLAIAGLELLFGLDPVSATADPAAPVAAASA
jgi:AcrR family transcriptional regulator